MEADLILYQCLVLSKVCVRLLGSVGGGLGGLTLRHDGCCNGLLALPCTVDFAA